MRVRSLLRVVGGVALISALTACGGGGSSSPASSSGGGGSTSGTTTTPTIGGTVAGLSAGDSVTLLNNGGDALIVTADGGFVFSNSLATGTAYTVTVQSHSAGIDCTVAGGSGTAGSTDVASVSITCATGTETILYSFAGGNDGANPEAGLIMDSGGNFYGTTFYGGVHNGAGTVFKLSPTGAETILYSFAGSTMDGADPQGSLLMDGAGNLYGSTYFGGNGGDGAVFEVSPSGTETVLHLFTGGPLDGASAQGNLVMDGSGNLYGTTHYGGASGFGTVYEITPAGAESLLHSFAGPTSDGANPQAGLIMDDAGNFYGTTVNNGTGSNGSGTVFEITVAGVETVIHSFAGSFTGTDGTNPEAALIMDSAGNLYGTTDMGGANNVGTVFKISAAGTETVLYSFAGGTTDGSHPQASLIMDSAGNLYGTTYDGGASNVGTVFKVTASGTETVLHVFTGGTTDGAYPEGGLVMDSVGNLYGTTMTDGANGVGTVFEIN